MPVSVVVGGQFGSEGKGKVSHYFAKELNVKAAVRVGGMNSGHTVVNQNGERLSFQILPTPSILEGVICILPAGIYFNEEILFEEIGRAKLPDARLFIDPFSMLIKPTMQTKEKELLLSSKIGSTESGTGMAVVSRILRNPDNVIFAKDSPKLRPFIQDTKSVLRKMLDDSQHIIIEGTQGYGLSLLHSGMYPYATSRDTTASGFLSEVGLSPFDVKNIIMVLRAYPIRVSGNSGPLPEEIDWVAVSKDAKTEKDLTEYTTVTKRPRRVARFEKDVVVKAITANAPNIIVLNHCDYFDYSIYGKENISEQVKEKISFIESGIGHPVNYIGTSEQKLFSKN
jgi:adenylosuccinate synthase